jgi:catechol 2,3-dioxygenase-like lactoylglutathione lyase family enzyme
MPLGALTPELSCSDIKRSLDFYVRGLGFEILYERSEEKFAYLRREGAEIMLEELGAGRTWITGELIHPFGRGLNLQIATKDVETLYKTLQKAGYSFFLPLEEKWYRKKDMSVGNWQFIIQDPDGYLLRFAQNLGSKPAHT